MRTHTITELKKRKIMTRCLFKCPHCGSRLKQTNSRQEHDLFRVAYFYCENVFCGFTARGEFAITHEVSPSAIPNPEVNLKNLRNSGIPNP